MTDQCRAALAALIAVIERDADLGVRASAAFAAADLLRGLRTAGIKPNESNFNDPIDSTTLAKTLNASLEREPGHAHRFARPVREIGTVRRASAPRALCRAR